MEQNDFVAPPSATGIVHCLQLLAQEAASLKLLRTLSAIEDALEMAACESGSDGFGDGLMASPGRHMVH